MQCPVFGVQFFTDTGVQRTAAAIVALWVAAEPPNLVVAQGILSWLQTGAGIQRVAPVLINDVLNVRGDGPCWHIQEC